MRPIEEILATPVQVVDITATSATVQLETSIDVVCSVVFGLDDDYGVQSTDLDMAGRGHSVHGPRLQGLEPDTTYHFRLQGTSADGTFFVSEDMTFQTSAPAAGQQPDARTNLASLAAGATVLEASSQFSDSPTWRPENALDSDPDTEWSSAGDGDNAFLTIELSSSVQIEAIGLWTRTMGSSAQISSFLLIADDGTEFGPFDVPDGMRLYEFPVSTTTRTLRFEVVASSGGNTGLIEIAAYSAE